MAFGRTAYRSSAFGICTVRRLQICDTLDYESELRAKLAKQPLHSIQYQTTFLIRMYLKSKASVASLCKWQSVGSIALLLGGASSICTTALAQTPDSPGPVAPITASWEGMSSDFTLEPPDPHGAAGPNGILQVINVFFRQHRQQYL